MQRQITFCILLLLASVFGQSTMPLLFDAPQLNVGVLESHLNAVAPITLTSIPTKFYTNRDSSTNGTVTISWLQTGIYGDFYYSRFPNVAQSANPGIVQDNANNDRSVSFNVGQEDIRTGVYYCMIADRDNPDSTSIEFNLVIEHHLSPSNFNPTGGMLSSDGYMQWQASSSYTPYYHIIVSDQRIRVENIDDDPEYEITGINIVYQAITPNTNLTYRDADPSGSFDNASSPRLASGKTYYWFVLNNYGNSPAMTSDIVTYLQAPSFLYSRPETAQPKPDNLFPADEATIGQNEVLTFRWSAVDNSIYHFYLYEEREAEGNRASYLYYDTTLTTGDTTFNLAKAGQMLVNTGYNWNVAAENGPLYSTGDLSHFTFSATGISMLEIKVRSDASGNPDVGRVNLNIRNINAPSSNINYLTDESGYFEREVQSSSYRITARKDGYFTTDTTVTVPAGSVFRLNLILRENPTYFTGTIQIPDNTVIPSVHIASTSGDENFNVLGQRTFTGDNTSQFTFRANVMPGEWMIYPFAKGFRAAAGDTITSPIQLGDYLELPVLDLEAIGSNIIVSVTDNNGKPLVDVTLTFSRGNIQQIIFAPNLPYAFPAEPGVWTVMVEKEGYFSQSDRYQVEVFDKQDSPLDVIMLRAANISGTVRDEQGNTLADVLIEATPQDFLGRYISTTSGFAGRYGPMFLKPGSYDITVTKAGYGSADTTITVASLDSIGYNPVLTQFTSIISGTIYEQGTNNLLAEARVAYRLADGSGMSVLSETDGTYELRVPSDETLGVFARKAGYATSDTIPLTLSEGEKVRQDFTLRKLSALIYGEVWTYEGGKPVGLAEATVTVLDPDSLMIIYSDQSDKDGNYKVYCDAGTVLVRAAKSDYTKQDTTLSIEAGASKYIPFFLEQTVGTVSGNVKTSDNKAVANQEVTATRKSSGSVVSVVTDAGGAFQFSSLLPGEIYTVTTKKLRYFTAPAEGYTIQVSAGNTTDINFVLTKANITSLIINYPVKEIANSRQVRFYIQAYAGEKQVAIGPPLWQISYSDSVRYITAGFSSVNNGLFIPKADALDAGISITAIDTADNNNLSVTESGFSVFAELSRRTFVYTNLELRDHSGMRLAVDSTDIEAKVGAKITLRRLVLPRSKAVSASAISAGNSFLIGGLDDLMSSLDLYLPVPTSLGHADFRAARIGKWDDASLSWETLEEPNYRISPYTMVQNSIDEDGEYIVFAQSEKLGIKNFKMLPNPFSPHLVNLNDPYNRGRDR
jgi:hypothetical protein